MIDIEKMKQAALAATQGEWKFIDVIGACSVHAGQRQVLRYSYSPDSENRANAEHIATANPSAVLELINRLEAAEQEAARYETLQNMSGLYFSYAVKYQLMGRLNDYVDAIKPRVDKAIAAMKE